MKKIVTCLRIYFPMFKNLTFFFLQCMYFFQVDMKNANEANTPDYKEMEYGI